MGGNCNMEGNNTEGYGMVEDMEDEEEEEEEDEGEGGMDKKWQKSSPQHRQENLFSRVVRTQPRQCVRYAYGGEPLWCTFMNPSDNPFITITLATPATAGGRKSHGGGVKVENTRKTGSNDDNDDNDDNDNNDKNLFCSSCGQRRVFEFQIMPQLLAEGLKTVKSVSASASVYVPVDPLGDPAFAGGEEVIQTQTKTQTQTKSIQIQEDKGLGLGLGESNCKGENKVSVSTEKTKAVTGADGGGSDTATATTSANTTNTGIPAITAPTPFTAQLDIDASSKTGNTPSTAQLDALFEAIGDGLDFGVVAIYVCPSSCEEGFRETAVVQPPADIGRLT